MARFPHWCPDVSTVVFIAARPGSDWKLHYACARRPKKPLLERSPARAWRRGRRRQSCRIRQPYLCGVPTLIPLLLSSTPFAIRRPPPSRAPRACGQRAGPRTAAFSRQSPVITNAAYLLCAQRHLDRRRLRHINDVVWTTSSSFSDTAFGAAGALPL